MAYLGITLAIVFMVIGLIGTLVPILPGVVITASAAFAYAWFTDFEVVSLALSLFFVLLAAIGTTSDGWMPLLGARKTGAPLKTLFFGMAGSVIGFFLGSFVPVLGNLLGAVVGYIVGLIVGEYRRLEDWNLAINAGIGGLIGWGLATVVQFVTALLILILFITAVWLF